MWVMPCPGVNDGGSFAPWSRHVLKTSSYGDRFLAVCDLVGVEWILIVLNVVTQAEMRRKRYAGGEAAHDLVQSRLRKAERLCAHFQSVEQCLALDAAETGTPS